ncbi:MAG: thiamine diphosphokinase [Peptostreptococcales bacterium]
MKVAIIANGTLNKIDNIKTEIKKYDYIICVDGGIDHAYNMGIIPDLIVGDLDSASQKSIEHYQQLHVKFETFPSEKNFTDTHLAVNLAIQKNASAIGMFAVTGTRMDHFLANMMLLFSVNSYGVKCKIMDDYNEMFIADNITVLKKKRGEFISLISLSECTKIIKLEGFKYPLENKILYNWETLGISNEIIEKEGKIIKGDGQLLVIRSCD